MPFRSFSHDRIAPAKFFGHFTATYRCPSDLGSRDVTLTKVGFHHRYVCNAIGATSWAGIGKRGVRAAAISSISPQNGEKSQTFTSNCERVRTNLPEPFTEMVSTCEKESNGNFFGNFGN